MIKYLYLLNSANVALLSSTISDSYAKMGNQDIAGPQSFMSHMTWEIDENFLSNFVRIGGIQRYGNGVNKKISFSDILSYIFVAVAGGFNLAGLF